MLLAVGAVLWLLTVVGDAAHGVLMFPVLKQHSERIAFGYLGARIVDAVFIAVMVLLILVQIPLGDEYLNAGPADTSYLQALSAVLSQAQLYAYEFGMSTVGVAGLILYYRVLPGPAGPAVPGRLGPRRVRRPAQRVGPGGSRVPVEFDARNPGRPVGAVHRRVADRQGLQHSVRPGRADHVSHGTARRIDPRRQRPGLTRDRRCL